MLRVSHLPVLVHANKEVEGEINRQSSNRVPQHLNDRVGKNEDVPSVRLGRAFSAFIEGALGDESGHALVYEEGKDDDKHKG